jgi:hypothetical protein
VRSPGLIIAGVVVLAALALLGQRLMAGERCVSPPELYGSAPAGYRYEPDRSAALAPGDSVYTARGRGADAFLIAVSVPDPDAQDLDAYLGLAGNSDIVSRSEIDGREVVRLAPERGGRAVAAYKACHFVQVGSQDPAVAEDVARAVVGD